MDDILSWAGLKSSLPFGYMRIFCPRKLNPFAIGVTWVRKRLYSQWFSLVRGLSLSGRVSEEKIKKRGKGKIIQNSL